MPFGTAITGQHECGGCRGYRNGEPATEHSSCDLLPPAVDFSPYMSTDPCHHTWYLMETNGKSWLGMGAPPREPVSPYDPDPSEQAALADVELNLGPERQVVVEPKLMDLGTDQHLYDRAGNVAGWDEIREWRIEVDNTREISVKVEVTRTVPTTYWKLDPGPESGFAKHDANHARFTIELPARSKRTINYTLTTYHGTREGQGK